METRNCKFRVKYSIVERDDEGKHRVFRKTTERQITKEDMTSIIDEIDSFEDTLTHQNRISRSLEKNSGFQRLKRFLHSWKYTYYEIMSI